MDLVTGANGFIGSHLVDLLLASGRKVIGIDHADFPDRLSQHDDNPDFKFYKDDIRYYISDRFKGVERVFHLAALADIVPSIEKPQNYFQTNVTGTCNVLEACRENGVKKIVYAASSSCYGLPTRFPTPETEACETQYPYALTKYLGEQLVIHWGRVYGLDTVSLRLFNVYGLRSRTSGAYGAMFGVFLSQLLHKKPLTVVGDGTQSRDFVHVSDVVRAFKYAADGDINGIFNVGTGNPVSVGKIAAMLGGEIEHIPHRPGEPDQTAADISKIQKYLGWSPEISIEQGVKELLDNIELWKDAPVWDKDSISEATKPWFYYLKGKK